MLDVLAKKYGIEQSKETWKIDLFNKVCVQFDAEERAAKGQEAHKVEVDKLIEKLIQTQLSESFLLSILKDDNTPSGFKDKLRGMMKAHDLHFDMIEGKPALTTPKKFKLPM